MKKKMIIGGTMLLGLLITFCSYTGVTEKPDIPEVKAMGESVPLGDPFILLHDGVYYAYGTHAADGIEVYTSKDLKRWKLHGLAPVSYTHLDVYKRQEGQYTELYSDSRAEISRCAGNADQLRIYLWTGGSETYLHFTSLYGQSRFDGSSGELPYI